MCNSVRFVVSACLSFFYWKKVFFFYFFLLYMKFAQNIMRNQLRDTAISVCYCIVYCRNETAFYYFGALFQHSRVSITNLNTVKHWNNETNKRTNESRKYCKCVYKFFLISIVYVYPKSSCRVCRLCHLILMKTVRDYVFVQMVCCNKRTHSDQKKNEIEEANEWTSEQEVERKKSTKQTLDWTWFGESAFGIVIM